ncbi:MAG: hypothetical protein DRP93_06095, partial [Candidatus Neomarinimicrobiota bacterium]
LGSGEIDTIKLGDLDADRVYLGDDMVWQNVNFTLSGSAESTADANIYRISISEIIDHGISMTINRSDETSITGMSIAVSEETGIFGTGVSAAYDLSNTEYGFELQAGNQFIPVANSTPGGSPIGTVVGTLTYDAVAGVFTGDTYRDGGALGELSHMWADGNKLNYRPFPAATVTDQLILEKL